MTNLARRRAGFERPARVRVHRAFVTRADDDGEPDQLARLAVKRPGVFYGVAQLLVSFEDLRVIFLKLQKTSRHFTLSRRLGGHAASLPVVFPRVYSR